MMTDEAWNNGFRRINVGEVHMIIFAAPGYTAVDYCVASPVKEEEPLVPLEIVVEPSSEEDCEVRVLQGKQVIFVAPKIAVMAFESVDFNPKDMHSQSGKVNPPSEFYS